MRETMVVGVEGGRGGVEMAGPAGVGEGYGVDVHNLLRMEQMRDEGVCFSRIRRVFAPQRQYHPRCGLNDAMRAVCGSGADVVVNGELATRSTRCSSCSSSSWSRSTFRDADSFSGPILFYYKHTKIITLITNHGDLEFKVQRSEVRARPRPRPRPPILMAPQSIYLKICSERDRRSSHPRRARPGHLALCLPFISLVPNPAVGKPMHVSGLQRMKSELYSRKTDSTGGNGLLEHGNHDPGILSKPLTKTSPRCARLRTGTACDYSFCALLSALGMPSRIVPVSLLMITRASHSLPTPNSFPIISPSYPIPPIPVL